MVAYVKRLKDRTRGGVENRDATEIAHALRRRDDRRNAKAARVSEHTGNGINIRRAAEHAIEIDAEVRSKCSAGAQRVSLNRVGCSGIRREDVAVRVRDDFATVGEAGSAEERQLCMGNMRKRKTSPAQARKEEFHRCVSLFWVEARWCAGTSAHGSHAVQPPFRYLPQWTEC